MRRLLASLLVMLLAVACGGDSRFVEWRGLSLTLPEGWVVFERADTRLSVADAPLGEEAGDPGDRAVAAQFTYEQGASADDWRRFVEEQDGDLEVDQQFDIGGIPATRLVFSYTTNGIPTREMVIVVPARQLVVLMQPVPVAGQVDAPEVFLEKRDQFDAIIDSIEFGAPVDEA